MPLSKKKTKAAFNQNVAEMIAAGHPQNQALAAAYSIKGERKTKRRLKKRSHK